ncbi:GNAT family N-acetyltransferase [Paenibacillus lutrae]|uniref:GNAT family N-acetyltransferase n=1 Tax=Paenibacillus lutrae TaxID=2078573 RepID=A0A7X3K128_9BACL|nr:GNAT family N-acetyltransferase [Paenibacillus lutrae]MVP01717.1 GNAT family N-acetyltransferase [Paenibacillus lutrae]
MADAISSRSSGFQDDISSINVEIRAIRGGLGQDYLRQLEILAEQCRKQEQLNVKLNWNMLKDRSLDRTDDFAAFHNGKLIAFLGLYSFQDSEIEGSGLVDPGYRRQGIFSRLLQLAARECAKREIPKMILICPRSSSAALGFVKKLSAYAFSEYVMKFAPDEGRDQPEPASSGARTVQLRQDYRQEADREIRTRPAQLSDTELLVRLNCDGFVMSEADSRTYVESTLNKSPGNYTRIVEMNGEAVGKLGIIVTGSEAYIVGFVISRGYRGRGIGRIILMETVDYIKRELKTGEVRLEVAVVNDHALGLYQSCGFHIADANDYYETPPEACLRDLAVRIYE